MRELVLLQWMFIGLDMLRKQLLKAWMSRALGDITVKQMFRVTVGAAPYAKKPSEFSGNERRAMSNFAVLDRQ